MRRVDRGNSKLQSWTLSKNVQKVVYDVLLVLKGLTLYYIIIIYIRYMGVVRIRGVYVNSSIAKVKTHWSTL